MNNKVANESALREGTEEKVTKAKLNKWFLLYEFVYIGVYIVCDFIPDVDLPGERQILLSLTVISLLLITLTAIVRIRRRQHRFMTNLFLLAVCAGIILVRLMS